MAGERVAASVLAEGLRIVGRGIREEPGPYAIAATGAATFGLVSVAGSLVITEIVERVVVPALAAGEAEPAALATAGIVIVALSLLKIAGIIARRIGAGIMQFKLQAGYRRRVTRRYLELPLAWHRRHPTGTLLSNANSDVEAIWFPIAALPMATGTVTMLLGAIVCLFVIDWSFALVGLAVFPLLFVINVVYARAMSPRIVRAQELRAQTSAIAHESFDGALVVKTMGRELEETERFAARARELRDAMIRVGRLRGAFDPLVDALPAIGSLAVFVVGFIRMRQGAVGVADIVGVAFLFTVLAFPIRAIGWVFTEMPRSVAGWDRVQAVLAETGEMTYGRRGLVAPPAVPASLSLRDVTFRYAGAESPVLEHVSLEVAKGQTVALVGPTGSGKSTLAALAARLVDPDDGRIAIDGIDIRELSAAELAATVALVPQLPFVFDDTIRGNIDLGRTGIGDRDVIVALGRAQADGFVRNLPEGLDTPVGERGTSLSGGQRQRLTLARALAGHPRLLILDDATSAVDPRVEAAILRGLRDGGASILVVAYRRATIALADEVVYLEHGRVVARGKHTTLLESVPGYADLVTAYERAEAERRADRGYEEASR